MYQLFIGYICIEMRNHKNIKVLCLIVYFITDIVVENIHYFLDCQFTRKKHIGKFLKLKSVPDFETV